MYLSDLHGMDPRDRAKTKQTGLLFGRTGTPAFVVGTTVQMAPEPFEISDPSQLLDRIPQTEHLVDKLIHLSVRGFFSLGGQRLIILPITLSKPEDINDEIYEKLLGSDAGFPNRSGFHALKNYDGIADLLVFPQLAALLPAVDLGGFYQAVLAALSNYGRFFLLIDTPCYSDMDKGKSWALQFSSPYGAVFYPWTTVEEVGFLAPSILISALLQTYDRAHGISQSPANREIPSNVKPLVDLTTDQIRSLTDARINVFRYLPSGELTLWGCYNTSKSEDDTALIHVFRTLKAIEDAIQRTCEAYVLEAKTPKTCDKIREAVSDLLKGLQSRGFFAAGGPQVGYRIHCEIEPARRGQESFIDLDVEIAIERPEDFIGLRLKY